MYRNEGETQQSQSCLKAIGHLDECKSTPFIIYRFADVCKDVGMDDEAVVVLRNCFPDPIYVNEVVVTLLKVGLQNAKYYTLITEICDQLRAAHIVDERPIEAEIALYLNHLRDFEKAAELIQQALRLSGLSDWFKRGLRSTLSLIGQQLSREDLIEKDVTKLQSIDEIIPEQYLSTLRAYSLTDAPLAADKLLYEWFRKHPNEEVSFSAVPALIPFQPKELPATPEKIDDNSAFLCQDLLSRNEVWAVIEPDNPQNRLNEHSPDSAFAKNAIGKCVGDTFTILGDSKKEFEILGIKHKYLYRIHSCLKDITSHFPGNSSITAFNVDIKKRDFGPLLKLIKEGSRSKEQIIEEYKTVFPYPILFLAGNLSEQYLRQSLICSDENDLPYKSFASTRYEFERYGGILPELKQQGSIAIDTTAFASMVNLGLADVCRRLGCSLVQPHTDWYDLGEYSKEVENEKKPEYMQLGRDADGNDAPFASRNQYWESLQEKTVNFARSLDGVMVKGDSKPIPEIQSMLIESGHGNFIGEDWLPWNAPLAIAKTNVIPLWTDCACLEIIAKEHLGIRTVNTQGLLFAMMQNEVLTHEEYLSFLLEMHAKNYRELIFGKREIEAILEMEKWNFTSDNIRLMLKRASPEKLYQIIWDIREIALSKSSYFASYAAKKLEIAIRESKKE